MLKIGQHIGLYPTLGIVIGTGVAGGLLAKWQGLAVLRQVRADLERGVIPAEGLFDGLIVLVAGALLITPGLLTDTLGLILISPWGRRRFKAWIRRKLEQKIARGEFRIHTRYYTKEED